MNLRLCSSFAFAGLMAVGAFAQTGPSTAGGAGQSERQRSFAIVAAVREANVEAATV